MPLEFRDFDGDNYVSHNMVLAGPYVSTDDIGEANCRVVQGMPGAYVQNFPHNIRQVWLPDTQGNREFLQGLDEYPLLDDATSGEVIVEWEEEAWDNWLRDDLLRTLPGYLRDLADEVDNRGQGDIAKLTLWELYRESMDRTNTYPVAEGDGVTVDVKGISLVFRGLFEGEVIEMFHELAPSLGLPEEAPLYAIADRMEEEGHDLADVARRLSPLEV